MEKLLETKNLVKKYREGTLENRVVDNIDLDVGAGEFVIIMGASGSGKTSLLHLIAGIDTPDEGTIRYAQTLDFERMGERDRTMFRRRNIGIVFQQQCLIPDLTIYENIMLPVMLNKKTRLRGSRQPCISPYPAVLPAYENKADKTAVKDMILTLCGQFGLKEHINKYPAQLSGGQQQRAAILRAVANTPALLLCDEPTGSLNSAQAKTVLDLLSALNQKGQTIVLVTHDIKVAVMGERIIYITDGRMAGELNFTDGESAKCRENELMRFLQQRGW